MERAKIELLSQAGLKITSNIEVLIKTKELLMSQKKVIVYSQPG